MIGLSASGLRCAFAARWLISGTEGGGQKFRSHQARNRRTIARADFFLGASVFSGARYFSLQDRQPKSIFNCFISVIYEILVGTQKLDFAIAGRFFSWWQLFLSRIANFRSCAQIETFASRQRPAVACAEMALHRDENNLIKNQQACILFVSVDRDNSAQLNLPRGARTTLFLSARPGSAEPVQVYARRCSCLVSDQRPKRNACLALRRRFPKLSLAVSAFTRIAGLSLAKFERDVECLS